MPKATKIIIACFAAVVIAIGGYFVFPKSHVTLSVAPSSFALKVDNGDAKQYKGGQTIFVFPGTHTYVFTRDGFTPLKVTLATGNNETKEILEVMNPETDAARQILADDAASYDIQERVGGRGQSAALKTMNDDYPILKSLPVYEHSYAIEACPSQKYPDDRTKIALCVTVTEDAAQADARDYIQSLGYDPSTFEIIYQNQSADPSTGGSVTDDD